MSSIFHRKIIVIRRHVSDRACCLAVSILGGRVVKRLPLVHAVAVAGLSGQALDAIACRSDVEAVADDIPIYAFPAPGAGATWVREIPFSDELLERRAAEIPWGVRRIRAPEVWPSSRGENVKIAVVDTGIETGHPDLRGRVVGGYSAIGSSYEDENGHGTHVAGIVAATGAPGGVFGVAPKAELLAVRVLDENGSGSLSDLIDGLSWTSGSGAHIVNLSLGSPLNNPLLERAIKALIQRGVLVVAAVGNSGPQIGSVGYPAKLEGVIGVGASDRDDGIATFSSRGCGVDLAAPGVGVRSTWIGGGYRTMSGTSMAAPHVAGVCALLWSRAQEARSARAAIMVTAERLGCWPKSAQGQGLVQAKEAYVTARRL